MSVHQTVCTSQRNFVDEEQKKWEHQHHRYKVNNQKEQVIHATKKAFRPDRAAAEKQVRCYS
jgi:hypothetical protein